MATLPSEVTGQRPGHHQSKSGSLATARGPPRPPPEERTCYSIPAWCRRNSTSRATFYRWKKLGLAPRVIRVGGKSLITQEDDLAWREARMAEALATE
jgi:hypothetical protein